MGQVYTEKEIKQITDAIPDIEEKALEKQRDIFGPSRKEVKEITKIIVNYIKEHKRIGYGGYALNLLIKDVCSNDCIYSETDEPDIDFYSPYPLEDVYNICNILFDKGYKLVSSKEALHKETYTIFANMKAGGYCDITYVPNNIFKSMPIRTVDGLKLIDPEFMMIDYYRMLTDPLVSYWRIQKAFRRYVLLQKYFALQPIDSQINPPYPKSKLDIKSVMSTMLEYIKNKSTFIMIGLYAYNFFLRTSNYKNFKYVKVPYYEIISTNYSEDCKALINLITTKFPDLQSKIKVIEYYPYFQFYGFNLEIRIDDIVIAHIYDNNRRCYTYNKVPYTFDFETFDKKSTIQIGSFYLTTLYILVSVMKARTDQNKVKEKFYRNMYSDLFIMRRYFLDTYNQSVFDDNNFKEFSLECVGETMPLEREHQSEIKRRKKLNKMLVFKYNPDEKRVNEPPKYVFFNSSGNEINNPRNVKVLKSEKPETEAKEETTETTTE